MQNFAALSAAVFPPLMKNLKGGGYPPPPRSVRGINRRPLQNNEINEEGCVSYGMQTNI